MLRQTLQDLERLLEIYQEDIGPRAAVVPEVQRLVNEWKKEDVSTVPSSAIEALCACHADIYPSVYISGSQTGGKLPLVGNMQFIEGLRKTKTTLLFCTMTDNCKINFRPEMRKIYIEGNKT